MSHSACELLMMVPAQVWYSAAWRSSTLTAFRVSLTKVLMRLGPSKDHSGEESPLEPQPPAVMEILRHWQCHDVPLSTARSLWLASLDNAHSAISNFKCVLQHCRVSDPGHFCI